MTKPQLFPYKTFEVIVHDESGKYRQMGEPVHARECFEYFQFRRFDEITKIMNLQLVKQLLLREAEKTPV